MRPNIIHSIAVCLAALALPFMVACSSQEESLPESTTETTLHLHIAPMGAPRAGRASLSDNEKLHDVRIVILHADGKVERNNLYDVEGAQEQKSILLRVSPNERKKVYLFANEESVTTVEGVTMAGENKTLTAFLNSFTEGTPGFEETIDDLYFAPDYSGGKPIPMSSVYEIDFPEGGSIEETMYVVRVATKFTVNFMNWRGKKVTVEDFTIASHADKNFLMAHVLPTAQNQALFSGKSWIEWLKEVSDASSENDSYDETDAAGWLKDYQLPEQANRGLTYTHGPVTVGKPTIDIDYPDNSRPGLAENPPFSTCPKA